MNEFFKKHTDTMVVLGAIFAGFLWMNGKFNSLEKDIAVMKTVLIMQKIMPAELAVKE
jgi:type IV secretory pathway VirB2 component (pilin)